MKVSHLIWPLTYRKVLLLLVAVFLAWSWQVQKPAPVAAPSEQVMEYLWA